MRNSLFILISVLIVAVVAAVFVFPKALEKTGVQAPEWFNKPFQLGLDLQGGAQLIYKADTSQVVGLSAQEAMQSVRSVVERRANMFGVSEPTVQVSNTGEEWRLIVELPGVENVNQAIEEIGATPFLEFRTEDPENPGEFESTALNGAHLAGAQLGFDPNTGQPLVELSFNQKGTELFSELTKENIGKPLAVFLDGSPISVPTVQNEITAGRAVITGNFTVEEAKQLAQRMSAGALPVPIELISQRSVGASLGQASLAQSLQAAYWGLAVLALFMLLMYRERGAVALLALGVYIAFVLSIFKLIPVTLTLAGIAGFVLSMGMAVDANVLIFERFRKEKKLESAFRSAWPAIRDGSLSTLLVAIIIFFASTSFVKGFGLTLIIGILVSLFTAVFVTRLILQAIYSRHA